MSHGSADARVVLDEPAAVVELSTAEPAAASGTSPATVVRACQRLGFRGFRHLRLELAGVTPDPEAAASTPVGTAFGAAAEALTATRATVYRAGFGAIVDLIVRARRILLVGNGFSSSPIQDAALQFTTAGRSVEAPLDILPVLPSDIEVTSTDSAGTAPGITMSSLFGRDSSDVVASCRGTEFRCAVHGTRPVVGDRAGLTIRRALFYPAPTEADVPLATGAAALAGSPR